MALNISPASLDASYVSFDLRFQQGLKRAAPQWNRIAMQVPSTTGSNTYAWLKSIPGFRKWVGPRVFHSLVSRATTLTNEDYEDTFSVPRNAYEDEQLGIYGNLFEQMGTEAGKWPDKVLATAIKAGTTAVHYDGQPFFHNSHPIDPDDSSKGTYSNNKTSFALSPDNYGTAVAEFAARVNDAGEPMGIVPDLLLVPPQLRDMGKRILETDLLARAIAGTAAADRNIYQGTGQLMMMPELADQPDTWYLMSAGMPLKPFVWQERKAPVMIPKTAADDPNVLLEKELWFLGDARGAAGYAFPFLITRCTA